MALTPDHQTLSSLTLQEQAIGRAKAAASHLPGADAIFRQCVDQPATINDLLTILAKRHKLYKGRVSTKLLDKFQSHTAWLQNLTQVVDTVVQVQAGIGCPLWAPIKFVLLVQKDKPGAGSRMSS